MEQKQYLRKIYDEIAQCREYFKFINIIIFIISYFH